VSGRAERVERLERLVGGGDGALDRALAVVASVDPDGPPTEDEVVARLDRLAQGLPGDEGAPGLLAHLFGSAGFAANRGDYYDPANSLIHRVIDRRRGIPLSLAAVAAEVGRRKGIDLRPVGLPGHVVLGEGTDPDRWFDPFAAGAALDIEACRRIFAGLNPEGTFHPAMLAPMEPLAVVVRTLNNLRVAYANRGMASRLVPVLELRADLSTGTVGDRLELARLLAGLGRIEQAATEFETLARSDPARSRAHLSRARDLRARLN
jgi:regulator of sirC expression with transglutaminase-like and TPR domain